MSTREKKGIDKTINILSRRRSPPLSPIAGLLFHTIFHLRFPFHFYPESTMEHTTDIRAGPSKLTASQTPRKAREKSASSTAVINDDGDDPRPTPAKATSGLATGGQGDEEEEGEERMDFKLIQSFAEYVSSYSCGVQLTVIQ